MDALSRLPLKVTNLVPRDTPLYQPPELVLVYIEPLGGIPCDSSPHPCTCVDQKGPHSLQGQGVVYRTRLAH